MIFPLSIIFVFGLTITTLVFTIINNLSWYLCILLPLGVFVLVLGLFCLLVMLLLIFIGKHYAKTYDPKNPQRWFFMTDVARFSTFWLGVHPVVHGLEKIPKDTPIVIYCNHQSYLDMFILYVVLKDFPHATMYKKIIETYPLAAGMAKALGGLSIERDDDKQALKVVINIINEVKKGVNFLIFPEGTRSKGLDLHPYKAGSFKICQKALAPAVIIAIDGAYKKLMTVPFIPTFIYVKVVDVLDINKWENESTANMANYVQDLVNKDLIQARNTYWYLKPSKKYIKKSKQANEYQKKQ